MSFDPNNHLTDLRGKKYLEVAWRIAWFRDAHPHGTIETELISTEPLIVKASVSVDGRLLATGHGSADAQGKRVVWSGRELEKAETAAMGRALGAAGFGTQFASFYDAEDDHLADSPRGDMQRESLTATFTIAEVAEANGKKYLTLPEVVHDGQPLTMDTTRAFANAGYDVSGWREVGRQWLPYHGIVHYTDDGIVQNISKGEPSWLAWSSVKPEGSGVFRVIVTSRLYTFQSEGHYWLMAQTTDGKGIRLGDPNVLEEAGYDSELAGWRGRHVTEFDPPLEIQFNQYENLNQFVSLQPFFDDPSEEVIQTD